MGETIATCPHRADLSSYSSRKFLVIESSRTSGSRGESGSEAKVTIAESKGTLLQQFALIITSVPVAMVTLL